MRFAALGPITIAGAAPGAPQIRRLLAELLVARNRPVPQDTLIEALWDGSPPPAAVSAFQSKVSRLRRLLVPGELRSTPAGYVLEVDDGGFDVAVFDELARAAGDPAADVEVVDRCGRALALWRGAAFEIAASDPLVEPEARRLELLRLRTVERKLGALAALGRHDAVLAECLPLIAEDPFAEPAWEARITALAAVGRRIDALRAFEDYRRVLADQTGLVPSARLQALARQVLDDRLSPAAPPVATALPAPTVGSAGPTEPEVIRGGTAVPTPRRTWTGEVQPNGPLVGRSPLVTAVRGWIDGAGRGRPRSVVVLGAAGTGKTSTIHELARRARTAGLAVRTLRSRSPAQPLFHPFAARSPPAGPLLATARQIAGRLVDEAIGRGGLVVALDDLHLADAGTIEAAAATAEMIGEHGDGLPLLLVIASTPMAPGCQLDRHYDRLAREPDHRQWVLGPLDEAGVHELVRSRTGLEPTPVLTAALTAASGGVPYVCLAHLRSLHARRELCVTAAGRLHAPAGRVAAVPADLRPASSVVMAALSPVARDLVAVAALYADDGGLPLLARHRSTEPATARAVADVQAICGLDDATFGAALAEIARELAAHGVPAGQPGHGRPGDGLVREAIRACLGDAELQDAHRRIAEHLRPRAAGGDPVAATAFFEHAVCAGLDDDPGLLAAARLAGEAASTAMRWSQAAHAFGYAADRAPTAASLLAAGIAGFRNHDAVDCRRHLLRAVHAARQSGDAFVEGTAALVLQRSELILSGCSGRFDETFLVETGHRVAGRQPGLAAQAWALVAEARFHHSRYDRGLLLVDDALRLPIPDHEHGARSALALAQGLCLLGLVRLDAADAAFEQARVQAEAADDAWKLGRSVGRRALTALYRGDAGAALRHCAHARTIERSTGNWAELALTECIAASAHGRRGDVDAALDAADDALALTKRSAHEWTARPALSVALFGACRRGDIHHAVTVLADMAELVHPRMARRWARLAAATLPDLPTALTRTHPHLLPTPKDPVITDLASLDIRALPRLGLAAEMARRTDRPLDPAVTRHLARMITAGARSTLGWPFDLDALRTSGD